ncbi:MAG TPA: MFS transporter [Rhizomicrobium sp.]|jgi:SHS family lactate transporter-like MFS transporter
MAILTGWTPRERHAVIAAFLAWSLDAFDFFVLVFVLGDVADSFKVPISSVAWALTLTLAFRPLGAFIFGRLADRFGRRPVLMINIAFYSLFGFLTAFSPNLMGFFIIRSLFGVAMGGIWGIGASMAFETVHSEKRGFVSGVLQSGYSTGYLFASITFYLLYSAFGWRGLFIVGLVPAAALIAYIWMNVTESPAHDRVRASRITMPMLATQVTGILIAGFLTYLVASRLLYPNLGWYGVALILPVAAGTAYAASPFVRKHWRLMLFAVVMMTAFNFFSHGTQDIYPTFLQKQHGFGKGTVSLIAVLYNIAAVAGGITFGILSQRFGRRRASMTAALIAIPVAFLWAFSPTAVLLGLGAMLMQFMVQGAWGVVPAHLNELSPADARGTFPGTVYQLGNLIASVNAVLQTTVAERSGGNYGVALASVAILSCIVIAICMKFGPEAKDVKMG